MKKLLLKLTDVLGPSGREDTVRAVLLKELKPLADEIRVDSMGNVIAHKNPSTKAKSPKRIMLAANMDEIAVIVNHIDENGYVRFSTPGTTKGHFELGTRMQFLNGVKGIVWGEPSTCADSTTRLTRMYIDVGATRREDCHLQVGDFGSFERFFMEVGNRLVANSLSARAGLAILFGTLVRTKSTENDVFFVFSVQGQVGGRGMSPATFGVDPEIGIKVGVIPESTGPAALKNGPALGRGPCILIRDEDMIADPHLVDWMASTAEKSRIPFQRSVSPSGDAEAGRMQISRTGVLTGGLSIPIRYIHSSSEMVDYRDLENAVNLLGAMLSKPFRMRN